MTDLKPIPQPRTAPVVGNLKDFDGTAPVQGLMRLARAFGPIYQLDLLGRRLIVLSSQELVNEVCDETRFDKRLHMPLKHIRDFAGDGLFTAFTGEENWGKAHRLLMPAFGPIGIRGMFDRMLDIADQMFTRWERFGERTAIDVADNMTRLTLDTIALCAFDYRFNSFYQNEMHPFVGAMVDALTEAGARARRPDIASRLMVSTRRRYEADIRLLHDVADGLIAERRLDPQRGQKKDLLDLMLDGRDPQTGERLSDENVRYQMVTFLIAGHETTSGLLSFALYLLLKNPHALARLREEVDEVLGQETPRVEHLARLRYTEQVLMESLRIWPTAPAFALRSSGDTIIGGRYRIQRSDTLLVLIPSLHRDPQVWGDDPEAFRPERFTPQAASALPPNAWKPFGNGRRACIGRGFAMQEAQLVLALLMQRFDIVADDPQYQLVVTETLTLKPSGFFIRAKPRGSLPLRLRGGTSAPPSRPLQAPKPASPAFEAGGTPLLVLYGSNSGSSEAFAQRIASDAAANGYAGRLATLDESTANLPTKGAVVIVTASYEGQPTDNARQFVDWLAGLGAGTLAGVKFAVFGCGNRQWARTWQAVPRRIDAALEAAGAMRIKARGETDASGDFFGAFDDWYASFWRELGQALGKARHATATGPQLQVELVREGRSALLRQGDLQHGLLVENRELADMRSPIARSKRHFEIALPEGMRYRTGDYLAVLGQNPALNVDRALRRFGFAPDSQVVVRKAARGGATHLPTDYPMSVSELLSSYVELGQPATRSHVAALAQACPCPPEQAAIERLAGEQAYAVEVLDKRLSVLDLLERFGSCDLPFAAFLAMLPPMRARQYSISSSPLWNDKRCTLTVAVVDSQAISGQGRYVGIASSYLADSMPGARLSVAVRPSNVHFHPPQSPLTPIVMVCAGTGIAPFRGFIQERAIQAQGGQPVGPALLFYGCDHPEVDFLYRDELAEWEAAGVVCVRPAFSEAPEDGVGFVQHRVWKDRAEVAELFRQGAIVYVCGDGRRMAPAVRETFVCIYAEASGVTREEAEEWADKVSRETARYVADVFA